MSNMVLSRCVLVSVLIMQEFAFNSVLWPRLGFESQTQDFYFNQIAVTFTLCIPVLPLQNEMGFLPA